MDRDAVSAWLEGYFAAWASNDPQDVTALFTEDAAYAVSPFRKPWEGRDRIVKEWTSEAQDDLDHGFEVVAVDGDVAVAHWRVQARFDGALQRTEMDGVLLLRFAPDGRCSEHREWYVTRELPPGA